MGGPTSCEISSWVKGRGSPDATLICLGQEHPSVSCYQDCTTTTKEFVVIKRWQPLYDDILATVTPKVDFIQCITDGLENDDFVAPNVAIC